LGLLRKRKEGERRKGEGRKGEGRKGKKVYHFRRIINSKIFWEEGFYPPPSPIPSR